eukprot:g5495.t1
MDEEKEKKNILFIVCDQERRWSDLPDEFLEHFEDTLPGRARLRSQSVSFENFFINCAPCTPSRAVMYTGQHFQRTGVYGNDMDLPLPASGRCRTIGHILQEHGFRTAYKGKWHLTSELDVRRYRSIDTYEEPEYGFADVQRRRRGDPNYEGQDRNDALEPFGFGEWNSMGNFWGAWNEGFFHDPVTAEESVSWLRERSKELSAYREEIVKKERGRKNPALNPTEALKADNIIDPPKPWFLAVNFINPHDIMFFDAGGSQAASRLVKKFNKKIPFMPAPTTATFKKQWGFCPSTLYSHKKSNQNVDEKDEAAKTTERKNATFLFEEADMHELPLSARHHRSDTDTLFGRMDTEEEFVKNLDFYLNCLVESDRHIVRLLDVIDESGLADNTIIVFTSDHGEMAGSHSLRQKGNLLYKENVAIPLLVRHPQLFRNEKHQVSQNRTTTALGSLVDVVPTLLSLAGISSTLIQNIQPSFPGFDLSYVLGLPSLRCDVNRKSTREENGVLFQYGRGLGQLSKTLQSQCLITTRYRYGRFFDPEEYTIPVTFEELFDSGITDVVLFDTEIDPDETINLAAPSLRGENRKLLMDLNAQLNRLIARETLASNVDVDAKMEKVSKGGGYSIFDKMELPWTPLLEWPQTTRKVRAESILIALHSVSDNEQDKTEKKIPYYGLEASLEASRNANESDDAVGADTVLEANSAGVMWGTPTRKKRISIGPSEDDDKSSTPLRAAFERRMKARREGSNTLKKPWLQKRKVRRRELQTDDIDK